MSKPLQKQINEFRERLEVLEEKLATVPVVESLQEPEEVLEDVSDEAEVEEGAEDAPEETSEEDSDQSS